MFVSLTTWVNVKGALCSPDAKGASLVLLQSSRADDLVTVWLAAFHHDELDGVADGGVDGEGHVAEHTVGHASAGAA